MKRKTYEGREDAQPFPKFTKLGVGFDVIQIGMGPMGRIIANLMIDRKNINLKGVVDIDVNIIGKSLKEVLNRNDSEDILVGNDMEKLIDSAGNIDIVFIATASSLIKVAKLIKICLKRKLNVLSICEELSYPYERHPKLIKEIHELAVANGVSVLGTGINPGYLMDLLPLVITAPVQTVKKVKVTRMMNSAKRRVPFQKKIGTGMTVAEFHQKIKEKKITGHVGLVESMLMILNAMGFSYDEVKEIPPEPVIAQKELKTSWGTIVKPGDVVGLKSQAYAKYQGYTLIELDFQAFAGDHDEYDSIEVTGTPCIHQKVLGGVHGDFGTSAMAVNMIPLLMKVKPGFHTMSDVPVPRNTEHIYKFE